MKLLISHRGNISGPNPERENHPDYLEEAIRQGFEVETDVWLMDRFLYLGHDEPTYKISDDFFKKYITNIVYHAKNYEAFDKLWYLDAICYWHENDLLSITSNGFTIVKPESRKFGRHIIYMLPEVLDIDKKYLNLCAGICSDYPQKYKEILWSNS